jgi:hypothetical protein
MAAMPAVWDVASDQIACSCFLIYLEWFSAYSLGCGPADTQAETIKCNHVSVTLSPSETRSQILIYFGNHINLFTYRVIIIPNLDALLMLSEFTSFVDAVGIY